ncbi:hypothetical protein BC829DRAFT_192399 [Chytridium lagenaria]|nr:hypothetical protein BC829DRAFT_192399 [Chytridium lagenaria]
MTLTEIHEKHRKNISLLELFEELLHKSCKVLTEKFTEERRIKSQKIEHVTIVERCKVVAEITNAAFNSVDFFRSFLFTAFSEPCKHSEAQRQTYLSLFLEMDSLSAFDFGSITEVGADSTLNMVLCVSEFLFDCVSRAEDEILRNRRCFVNWWTLFLKLFNFKLSEGCIDARLSIRNLFLQAHVLEMQSLEDAGSYYGLCLNAIEALGDQNGMGDVDIPNNISVLNAQAVRTKIVGISCKLYIQETSDLSKKGDHREVLLRLCPFFFGSFECASVKDTFPNDWPYVLQFGRNYVTIEATSTERHRIMDILVQAANQVGSNEEKFFCLAKSIVLLVRDFDSLPLLVFIKRLQKLSKNVLLL